MRFLDDERLFDFSFRRNGRRFQVFHSSRSDTVHGSRVKCLSVLTSQLHKTGFGISRMMLLLAWAQKQNL